MKFLIDPNLIYPSLGLSERLMLEILLSRVVILVSRVVRHDGK
jgi:hypothetical protein